MTLATRLAVAMILLVAVTVGATGWLYYLNLERELLPRVLDRIETHSKLLATDLQAHIRGARADVVTFGAHAAAHGIVLARLHGGIDPVDKLSEEAWRQRLLTELVAHLGAKPTYWQFRFIGLDDAHKEILRLDRLGPNGAVRVVPDQELQRIGDEPYFTETLKLTGNAIYVSPIDLNEDNGIIGQPHVPTLRVAAPVFKPDGTPFGVVAISIDMRPTLERIRSSMQRGKIFVVDARGNYLVNPDRSLEFGAQLGRPTDWRNHFPYFVPQLGGLQSAALSAPDPEGGLCGAALSPAIIEGQQWLGVLETIPNSVFMAPAVAIRNSALLVGSIAMLGAAALAIILARSLTRPINQLTAAVEGIGRNDPVAIPVNAGGETGVLARAFARAIGEANDKSSELEREIREHRFTEAARDLYAARERLFSAAVQSSNDAILTQSLDGTITGWNPAAERLFGFTANEAVGKNIELIVPSDRKAEVRDILRRIKRGDRIEQRETARLRKDGDQVQVSISLSPIKSPSGQLFGASMIVRDLTESRRTEQALRQQIEERRRIFETSHDLILITDAKGTTVQVSPSVENILGYLPEELIGRDAVELIHPDDVEAARAEFRASRCGEHLRNADTRYLHKDGRAVPISWTGGWSEPVRRHFFIGRDMTESLQAQERLRESAQLASNIIETAHDAFAQMDESGKARNWNSQAETMFGWSRQEALDRDLIDLIVAEPDRGELKVALGRFLASRQGLILGRRRELMLRRRDGREFRGELSVTALKTRDGFLFNGFFRDLTDKIAAEERIRQSEKMEAIGQLTGGIAHDFNNILTVITGTIEILAGAVAKEPQLAAITKMIDEAAARGADLTQHLLAFARRQPLQPREIDVNTLVIDTAKLLRPTLGEHIEIVSVLEEETCVAIVDPNQLATAILNLALNSRDAMPEGGKLVLETRYVDLDENYADLYEDIGPGRYALIAVSDTGNGIPHAIIDKVFNPFFTSKGPGKGTGLGLSMVYGFIKQSAGHIKIYSEEGHGTTIKMYLPPGNGTSVAVGAAADAALESGHETILVVEDDRLVRDYVLTQLHSLGYVTLAAANAAEALSIVATGQTFDLLFTDVIMPGTMNGRQLADAILADRPDLGVLFTSGYTEDAIVHHGRLDCGVLLLAKPYRKSDLARMIRRAIEG